MKVWITKYALSKGIWTAEIDGPCLDVDGNEYASQMIECKHVKTPKGDLALGYFRGAHFHGEGREWHRTEAQARARARLLRDNKIASLRKKIATLEKLEL